MKKQRTKPAKKRNSQASFSRPELAQKLGVDVRTVDRRCSVLGVQADPRKAGHPITYTLTPGQLVQLHRRLDHGATSTPPSELKQAKLQEEVENLRLKNKRARETHTPNWFFAELLQDAAQAVPAIVEAHFETYAIQGANKEPAELRTLGKATNDAIRAEVFEFLGEWAVRWEALQTESQPQAE